MNYNSKDRHLDTNEVKAHCEQSYCCHHVIDRDSSGLVYAKYLLRNETLG